MDTRHTGWLAALLAATTMTTACGGPGPGHQEGNQTEAPVIEIITAEDVGFVDDDVLAIPLPYSPSGGDAFTFCNAPADTPTVNLTNTLWLNFFAANEYAHFGYIGPALNALGFHHPQGGPDLLWAQCAQDLQDVRAFEEQRAAELEAAYAEGPGAVLDLIAPYLDGGWGQCARNFFESGAYDGTLYPAPALEYHLIQTPHDGMHLQFFSGGAFESNGTFFQDGSTQALFARHGSRPIAIVAFRGTEPDKQSDLLADAAAWRIDMANQGWSADWGEVHQGFYRAYESVADGRILSKIYELAGTGVDIHVTGHSLGGALATLFTARLMRMVDDGADIRVAGMTTFGSPKVGDSQFRDHLHAMADKLGVRLNRIRNGRDLVARVPGTWFGYRPVGVLTHVTEDGLDHDPAREPGYGLVGSIADHDIAGYDETMTPISGYYSRLLHHRAAGWYTALDVCLD